MTNKIFMFVYFLIKNKCYFHSLKVKDEGVTEQTVKKLKGIQLLKKKCCLA